MALTPRRPPSEREDLEQQDSGPVETPRENTRKRRQLQQTAEFDENNRRARKARKNKRPSKGKRDRGNSEVASSTAEVRPAQSSHRFPVAIVGTGERVADDLFSALAGRFSPLQFERAAKLPDADLVISVGANDGLAKRKRNQIAVIVDVGGVPKENSSIARDAKMSGAILLRLEPLLGRYGKQAPQEVQALTTETCDILADAIRQRVVGMQADIALASAIAATQDDLANAFALTASPADLLGAIDWPGKGPPKLWRLSAEPRAVQAVLGGKVILPAGKRQKAIPLPIDWKTESEETGANALLHSLRFVSGLLVYWLQKANRVSSNTTSQIDKTVKKRRATASDLLGSAGDLILDFLQHEAELPDSAWRLAIVQRRSCVLALYLLCCRTAAKRRIRFDEARCAPVFRNLLEALERIRPSAECPLGTSAGLANAALLVSLALPLRKIPYGAVLFEQSLNALCECQLAAGMSNDGFWREGLAQQSEALGTLRLLSYDLRQGGVSTRPIQAAVLKLGRFASALLQEEGFCPPINEWPAVRQVGLLRSAKLVLRGSASARKSKDTPSASGAGAALLFPDAGFFISRAAKAQETPESKLVVQVRRPLQGGMSLSFSCGKNALLVGGGAATGRASLQVRRATRLTPAAHNAVRINGQDYARANDDPAMCSFRQVWDQGSWAAAELVSSVFAGTQIRRTAIHVKPEVALLIVDEIVAEFTSTIEQFWHFAPELQPERGNVPDCLFSSHGVLSAAFAPASSVKMLKGGENGIGWTNASPREVVPNWYAVQRSEGDRVLMGACFRWGPKPVRHALQLEAHVSGWDARVTGEGTAMHFQSRDGQLTATGAV